MSQQIVLAVDKFFEIRQALKGLHYDRTRRTGLKPVNSSHRYKIKKRGRLEKQQLMAGDKRCSEFFNWIFSLREKALEKGLIKTDEDFARLLNTTTQSIKHWRNYNRGCGGHFPSDKAFKALCRLEVILLAEFKVTRNVNIKNKKFPKSRIKIINKIRGRKRLQAGTSY